MFFWNNFKSFEGEIDWLGGKEAHVYRIYGYTYDLKIGSQVNFQRLN